LAVWQIIGHERAVDRLERALQSNRLPHALLFTGPAGVGKTRLALELAKSLNCVGEDPPCGTCVHCHQIEVGTHPDVTVVEREDGKDSIRIEQVRELRDAASLRPFQGRRKVYVISGAESLTPQAADALLKTLEEPQPQLTLVLTATEDDALPATIVSRCRVVPLGPVEPARIAEGLVERGTGQADAERLARLARGSVGWALEASRQPKLVTQQVEMRTRLSGVLGLDLDARLKLAESLTADRKERGAVRRILEMQILLARDLLLLAQGLPPRLVEGEDRDVLEAQARRLSLQQIHRYLRALERATERIDQNVDARLTLEALLVAAP
jgi:DNA polymerase III subunit delta'